MRMKVKMKDDGFSRPFGTRESFVFYPALKRRAIVESSLRDCGVEFSML